MLIKKEESAVHGLRREGATTPTKTVFSIMALPAPLSQSHNSEQQPKAMRFASSQTMVIREGED